jgi:acyl-CoA thioester hydrolase
MPQRLPTEEYPFWTYDKLRYSDTDRQGHINNAVYATFLETGRVELLYNPVDPLQSQGCMFVIVSLQLDLQGEITYPGRVDIGTRVANVGRSSVTFEQGLFQNGQCVATASTVIVQMNENTRRSQHLSDNTVQRLSELMIIP